MHLHKSAYVYVTETVALFLQLEFDPLYKMYSKCETWKEKQHETMYYRKSQAGGHFDTQNLSHLLLQQVWIGNKSKRGGKDKVGV